MNIQPIIGLMSGTSIDGINATLVYTNGKKITRTKFKSITPYKETTYDLLQKAISHPIEFISKTNDYNYLSNLITYEHATAVKDLINLSRVKPYLVGFHGQTIFHNPDRKKSYQLGNGKLLSKLLKASVIYNFRSSDLEFGGEGAPIAPVYHQTILENLQIELPAIMVNIGGITNLTYWDGNEIFGFDTGPGNNLMDYFVQKTFNLKFDNQGSLASKGKIHSELITQYIKASYFSKPPPKSLERKNLFENKYLKHIYQLSSYDSLATLSALTTKTLEIGIQFLPKKPKNTIIIGGGQKNKYLVQLIKKTNLSPNILTGEEIGLNSDYIEAELIAFLAARKYNKLPSTFPSTTGVKEETILGSLIKYTG